jgi:hypothetical protein
MSDSITNEALKQLAEAATSGRWAVSEARTVENTFMVTGGEGFGFGLIADVVTAEDAAFIAAAREAVPRLLSEIEEKDAEIARKTVALERLANIAPADGLDGTTAGVVRNVRYIARAALTEES